MRLRRFLLISCVLAGTSCSRNVSHRGGLSWEPRSGTFAWPDGEVKIPPGFKYHGGDPTDTLDGNFSSPDGKLVIRYDIGWYAGAYANSKEGPVFRERRIGGARVWTARRMHGTTQFVAVTFPDAGCANFFMNSSKADDAELIERIAQTYRPGVRKDAGSSESCGAVPGDDAN